MFARRCEQISLILGGLNSRLIPIHETIFRPWVLLAVSAALFSVTSQVLAEGEQKPSVELQGGQKSAVSWEVDADVSGVTKSRFEGVSRDSDVGVLDTSFNAVASLEGKGGILYRFGIDYQRHDFVGVQSQPIPTTLQSYSLTVGADFQLGDAWLARIDFQPGFYGSGDVFRFGDFNVPIVMGASYFVNSDLQLVVGLSLNFERKYPVLGGIGLRWRMGHDWVLNGILPTPRIEYSLSQSLTVYAGADFRGDTYRVNRDFGRTHGTGGLDDAVADYSQIRVGTGISWTINPHATFQMEAGFVPVDDLDFHRADTRVRSSEIPPYIDLSLKARF